MSRLITDLLPQVKDKCVAFLAACEQAGYKMCVTQTLRTYAEQDAIYAQGRTKPGKIVTHAKGGESWHNFGRAFDAVPFLPPTHHDLWWQCPEDVWEKIGAIAEAQGLEWGGRWPGALRDIDHFEFKEGLTLETARVEHEQQC